MSDLPQQYTFNQYTGDGSTTVFTYSFLILLNTDVTVYLTPAGQAANPQADIQILTTDYTVQNVGNFSGGTITFVTAPPLNSIVTFVRTVQNQSDTEYVNTQTINGINLDNDFLRLMLCVQQLATEIQQSTLRYPINSYFPNLPNNVTVPVITNVDNQQWKSQGGTIIASVVEENPDTSTLRSDLANETQGGCGSGIVGHYDELNKIPTTVKSFLDTLPATLNSQYIREQVFLDVGMINAIQIILTSNYSAYTTGTLILIKAANTNSGATTFQINSLGTINLLNTDGSPLVAGSIAQNGYYLISIEAGSPNKAFLLNPESIADRIFYGASVYSTLDQIVTFGTTVTVQFDTVEFDPNSIFNGGQFSFFPKQPGYYRVSVMVQCLIPNTSSLYTNFPVLQIYKNGSFYDNISQFTMQHLVSNNVSNIATLTGSKIVPMNGTSDQVSLKFINTLGTLTPQPITLASAFDNYFEIEYIGH